FTNPTAGYSIADLASCNFPAGVLADVKLQLNGWNESGTGRLKWDVNMNNEVTSYEVQASTDGSSFETITQITPQNITTPNATYAYTDPNSNGAKLKYYRVRETMPNG